MNSEHATAPRDPSNAANSGRFTIVPRLPLLRGAILLAVVALASAAYFGHAAIGPRASAAMGLICFLGLAAACSTNLAAINWRTLGWGLALQIGFALLVIKLQIGESRPGEQALRWCASAIERFLDFANQGSQFIFGELANPKALEKVFGTRTIIFAFTALPVIIFVSAVFSLLHYWGVIQRLVALCSLAMKRLMQTSGAETLSAIENVFMGQSEAPLIVRPYIPEMTRSELLALMTAGMATLSGGMIAVYIAMGADPVAILATSIMSAPCSLYVAKLLAPETEISKTAGGAVPKIDRQHVNSLDAIAYGATTGVKLAIEIAAMIIAFLALLALVDFLLSVVSPGLSLAAIFAWIFSPVAALIGIPAEDWGAVSDLLGTKIVTNELVAYAALTGDYRETLSPRSFTLATYALGGFANFGSVGVQLGAMGAIAPNRRSDFAQLGMRALLGGYLATLLNAAIAAMLIA